MKLYVDIVSWSRGACVCAEAVGKVRSGHRITFSYENYFLAANITTILPPGYGARVTRQFSVSEIQHPLIHLEHELPIFAAFLLECHQRLSASIRDNKFNPKALENK